MVSDDPAGPGRARREHCRGVPWLRRQRHFLQTALERASARLEDELHERLRAIWDESDPHEEGEAASPVA